MSFLLNLYPAYQSINCMSDPEHINYDHWLTFWISCYFIDQMPLPGFITWQGTALLYFPDSTKFVRENIMYPAVGLTQKYAPKLKDNVIKFVSNYLPENASKSTWWNVIW